MYHAGHSHSQPQLQPVGQPHDEHAAYLWKVLHSFWGDDDFLQLADPVLLRGKPMLVQHELQLQGVHQDLHSRAD